MWILPSTPGLSIHLDKYKAIKVVLYVKHIQFKTQQITQVELQFYLKYKAETETEIVEKYTANCRTLSRQTSAAPDLCCICMHSRLW